MNVKYRYFHFFLYRKRKSAFSHLLYLCTELLLLNNYYFVLMLYLWDDCKGRIQIRLRFFLTVGSGSTLAGSRTLFLAVLTWHLLNCPKRRDVKLQWPPLVWLLYGVLKHQFPLWTKSCYLPNKLLTHPVLSTHITAILTF